jgi:Na+/H+-translocating membrane pyrophosphatase
MIFVFVMFWIIYGLTPQAGYTAVAFFVGAVVSIVCGTVGMIIATQANYRTTFCAQKSLADAFRTAYRAGCAMGFALVSLGLLGTFKLIYLVLIILINIFKNLMNVN